MNDRYRADIELLLSRPLSDDERAEAASLEALTPAHRNVVRAIYVAHPIDAMHYLCGVLPDVSPNLIRRYIYEFDDIVFARPVEEELRSQTLYESLLARPLERSEVIARACLDELSAEQRRVARALAAEDVGAALIYLVDIVWNAPGPDRMRFVEMLLQANLDFEGRSQVERELGRSLTPDELVVVTTADRLSNSHRAVLRTLVQRQRIACLLYLRAVVPDASTPDLISLIDSTPR